MTNNVHVLFIHFLLMFMIENLPGVKGEQPGRLHEKKDSSAIWRGLARRRGSVAAFNKIPSIGKR